MFLARAKQELVARAQKDPNREECLKAKFGVRAARCVASDRLSVSCSVMPNSLATRGLQPIWLLCPRDFPGKDTGVGCHFLLQEIFLIQGLNPGLQHCRWFP